MSLGFQLETLNWLIRNIVGYVVFAAIVLLQADIRRALVHLGRAPNCSAGSSARRATTTPSRSWWWRPATLASKRTGAIIVIERSIGLRNYIESGIPLDARLTYDLLVSIFQPTSPLHDGAVIVQGDRVAAAACFLPLTINPRLSRDLGSRHRAAIGVTEENDSVAIVVSEETGRISLVVDGDVERDLDSERLRDAAASRWSRCAGRIGTRREAGYPRLMAYHPFRNLGLKLLSICIARLLWLVVAGERVVERVLRVPVEFQNLPAGLEIVGNPPDTVEVGCADRRARLSRMAPGDMAAVIDLRDRADRAAAVPPHAEPGDGPVRHRDRPGGAGDADDGVRDDGRFGSCACSPTIDGKPAQGFEVTKRDGRTRRRWKWPGPRARSSGCGRRSPSRSR